MKHLIQTDLAQLVSLVFLIQQLILINNYYDYLEFHEFIVAFNIIGNGDIQTRLGIYILFEVFFL
jgi:hypothetical protein